MTTDDSTRERLEALLERDGVTVEDLRRGVAELDAADGAGADDHGASSADDRGSATATALKAGGLLGLLGFGSGFAAAGAASQDSSPQGRVGTSSRPLRALYTAELNGPVTGDTAVTSLVGDGLGVDSGALSAASARPDVDAGGTPVENVPEIEFGDGLTVTDDGDGTVTVGIDPDAGGNASPTVSVDVPPGVSTGKAATFTTTMGDSDGAVVSRQWLVDGQGADTGDDLEYTFAETGSHTVSVVVVDDSFGTATASATVDVIDPIPVWTPTHLQNIADTSNADYPLDGEYVVVADVDLSGIGNFDPIGPNSNYPFAGNFDGNGYTITGLTIDRPSEGNVGLFGYVDIGATIENVTLESVDVTAQDSVGGLVGANGGTVRESYATGTVDGSASAGGLIGSNYGTVRKSSATGSVNGSSAVGGLVGGSSGVLRESSATGSVTGSSDNVGGLVGLNNGTVRETYATGSVTDSSDNVGGLVGENIGNWTVTDGYWDTESTGQASSPGSPADHGLTTGEMQGEEAAANLGGFDFSSIWNTVDAENDSDADADDYPVLQALDRATQLEARE